MKKAYNLSVVFGHTRKDAHNVACWTVPLAIKVSVTRKWKKMVIGQQTEAMMVPATFTKHLVTIAGNMNKRKRLEEQSRATEGKEGGQAHNISRKWKVYNSNFQLFLF